MSDLIFTFEDGSEYLCHYGVLGMKWGVRHDREKTAQKVSSQLSKDRAKAQALRAKAYRKDTTLTGASRTARKAKYEAKVAKFERKANSRRARRDIVKRLKYEDKAQKYRNKANGYANSMAKIAKLNAKASKLEQRAYKLESAYNKQLSKIERREQRAGQKAVARAVAA